jgi:hypothetical protein
MRDTQTDTKRKKIHGYSCTCQYTKTTQRYTERQIHTETVRDRHWGRETQVHTEACLRTCTQTPRDERRETCMHRATDRHIGYTSYKEEYPEGQGASFREEEAGTEKQGRNTHRGRYKERCRH